MNKEEVLNTFLLANIPEIITQEEFDDVKKAIKELQQENKQLKGDLKKYQSELEKADSITQSCIFNGKRESEISYRKCLNMIAELKKELEEEKRINVEDLKEIDRQEEIIQDLRADYGNKAQVERDLLKERIDKAIEYIENNCLIIMNKEYIPDGVINCKDIKLLEILKGDSNE